LQQGDGAWSASGISLGSSVPGTIDVSCESLGNNIYQIVSTGNLNGASHQATAQMQLIYPLVVTSGSGSSGGGLLGLVGSVLKLVGNVVNGLLGGQSIALSNPQVLLQKPANAQELHSPLSGSYGLDAPGQVFWVNGDATLKSDVVIRGTLIVTGTLTISGDGIRITRTTSQPVSDDRPAALVVGGKVLPSVDAQATIDGGLWVGNAIGDNKTILGLIPILNGQGSQLDVAGPVMVGDGGVSSSYRGTISVRPLAKILSWNPASH
jgi:hypothetical protein